MKKEETQNDILRWCEFLPGGTECLFRSKRDGNTALNWSAAVLIFGIGLIQIAFYIVKETNK